MSDEPGSTLSSHVAVTGGLKLGSVNSKASEEVSCVEPGRVQFVQVWYWFMAHSLLRPHGIGIRLVLLVGCGIARASEANGRSWKKRIVSELKIAMGL